MNRTRFLAAGLVAASFLLMTDGCNRSRAGQQRLDEELIHAIQSGDLPSVQRLVNKGANVEAKDASGATPLFAAIEWGDPSIVKFLLDHGARVDAKDENGTTPLMEAARYDNAAIFEALLRKTANCGAVNDALFFAIEDQPALKEPPGYVPEVPHAIEALLQKCAHVDARDEDGGTPLMAAAAYGQLPIAKFLVERGADLEARDKHGNTALLDAACDCAVATMPDASNVIQFLLERGADVNAANKEGNTALIIASGGGVVKTEIVRLLLQHGANRQRTNGKGETALAIATRDDVQDVIRLLKNPPRGH